MFLTPPVEIEQKGMRIDKFLALTCEGLSRSAVQRLILEGYVSVDDDVVADNDFKVRLDDVYQVIVPEAKDAEIKAEDIPLDIVFEDDDLVVVNKPAGMVVHPAPGAYSATLVNALMFHCQDNLSGVGGVKRPGIVHRIDKDTSGLLVAAKTDAAHHGLAEQFFEHSIKRVYLAIVYGLPNPLEGRIEANIGRSPYDRKKMAVVQKGGKTAVTNYKVLQNFGNFCSKVECRLETGRTHQIRVHMAHIGCNLVGDQLYVKAKKTHVQGIGADIKDYVNGFGRQALHAAVLGFVHPRTKKELLFKAEVPSDFKELEKTLNFSIG